jgi:hypothetical protein
MPIRTFNGARWRGGNSFLNGNHETSDNSERYLRRHKPKPVDVLIHDRIDKCKDSVNQTRPQQRSHNPAQNDRASREHRSIKQSDQQRHY